MIVETTKNDKIIITPDNVDMIKAIRQAISRVS